MIQPGFTDRKIRAVRSKISGPKPNMSFCGRAYQNPDNKQEIWLNVGWNLHGQQRYPPFEQELESQIPEQEYKQLMEVLHTVFRTAPYAEPELPVLTMYLCMCTFGICWCPCCYLKKQVSRFNDTLGLTVQELCRNMSFSARLEICEGGEYGGAWTDAKGDPLMVPGKNATHPGGPPWGYNIVLTVNGVPPKWPPHHDHHHGLRHTSKDVQMPPTAQHMSHHHSHGKKPHPPAVEVVGMPMPPNVVALDDEDVVCQKCGISLEAEHRFCPSCGNDKGKQ